MLAATAGFINSTGGIDGDNPTEMSRSDIQGVITALVNANAKRITETIEGENRFGTGPKNYGALKLFLIDLKLRKDNKAQAQAAWETKWNEPLGVCDSPITGNK